MAPAEKITLTADTVTDTVADSIADSVADSIASAAAAGPRPHYGIVLERPALPEVRTTGEGSNALSWLFTALILIFVTACVRYRKNTRFFSLMIHDVVNVRERHNAFDDTLRETSFLWLLNLLWCGAAGVLLYGFVSPAPLQGFSVGHIALCIALAAAYTIFLTIAYSAIGNIFSDSGKAAMWVKGYLSTQAMEAILLFPIALLLLCLPELSGPLLTAGLIIFIFAKILFIYKGFCIFFTHFASWVLFLYYLCSLEIVPVILTYVSARYICFQ